MSRYGYSIFCDDIRNEAGGKLSFIGCYSSVMFVSRSFPFVLPKFCIHTFIVTSAEQPFQSVFIRCYVPERQAPVIDERIETPNVPTQRMMVSELEPQFRAPRQIVASASLVLSPFDVLGPGLISVRAVVDGASEELSLGSIRVAVRE